VEFEYIPEIPKALLRIEDTSFPKDWTEEQKSNWINGENHAYSVYRDPYFRLEGDGFFQNYFLTSSEPLLDEMKDARSIRNTSYYYSGSLVAFTSLFTCDFRQTGLLWHDLKVEGTIGIITRKTFSIRVPYLVHPVLRIPLTRIENLRYIKETINQYPQKTKFSICAHFQPESLILLRNLVKLGRIKKARKLIISNTKLESTLAFLPDDILETFEIQETVDDQGTAFIVGTFTN